MNLQNLHEGQVVKNYKELCRLLEIDEMDGNSKVSQLKEIGRYIEINKKGHSFVVIQIYKNELEKSSNRNPAGSRSLYVENFSVQLLHALSKDYHYKKSKGLVDEGANYMFRTPNQLSQLTGMVNKDYRFTRLAVKDFIENNEYSLSKFDIDEFFKTTTNKINSIIKTSMNNLYKRKILVPYRRHLFTFQGKQYVSDDPQETIITTLQGKIYEDMKFRGITRERKNGGEPIVLDILSEVYLSHRTEEFYERFNKELKSEYGWTDVYSGWKINFHTSRLDENILRYEKEFKILQENKDTMNEKFVAFMTKSSQKKYDENQSRYEDFVKQIWGEVAKKDYPFRYQEDYISSQALLTELFIKIK